MPKRRRRARKKQVWVTGPALDVVKALKAFQLGDLVRVCDDYDVPSRRLTARTWVYLDEDNYGARPVNLAYYPDKDNRAQGICGSEFDHCCSFKHIVAWRRPCKSG